LPPTASPVVATVPALEFVKLLETNVVPTGIAVGAYFDVYDDPRNSLTPSLFSGNMEMESLSAFLASIRSAAYRDLRYSARSQGNGVLAHVNFSQILKLKGNLERPTGYLARHIVVATTVDAGPTVKMRHDVPFVLDLRSDTPLLGTTPHHQSYSLGDAEGAI
jgi:hypothetical protein